MSTNYSVDDIERIINDFYSPFSHLTHVQRQEMNVILENLQDSTLAWDFSWKLLDINKSPSVQFFGAVVICNKISRHLSELNDDQIQQLFPQLVQRLIFYNTIHLKQITIKLTIALCHVILNMMPNRWNNGINTIITLFTQSQNEYFVQHPDKAHVIVLNTLAMLPEEFSRITVIKSQRSLIRNELEKEFPNVLQYLQMIVSTYNQKDILSQVFSCLAKWLEFGIPIFQIEIFFNYLFNSLNNEQLFDDIYDCLLVIFTLPDALKYPSTYSRLLPHILQLEKIFDQSLITGDKNKAESITKLITQFGENLIQLIVELSFQSETLSYGFCHFVMKSTDLKGQYPIDEICSELTFNFWHALQDELTSINDETKKRKLFDSYRPYFEHLIQVFIYKGQLPNNDIALSNEDRELFRSYRSNIIDTMTSIYNILGNRAMELLANHLFLSVEQNHSWQIQESIIQLISIGSEYIKSTENQILPRIFLLLPKLNFCNNSIMNSTLNLLGQYNIWLSNHEDILQNCIHLCINSLSNSDLVEAASIALKELIKQNRIYMSKHLNDIFPIMKSVFENIHIQLNDRLRCVSIIGYILSVHAPNIVIEHMNILLVPEIHKLLSYLSETVENQQNATIKKQNIYEILNFICVLITAISFYGDETTEEENVSMSNTSEVLCCVMHNLESIFYAILKQYTDDIQITEKICEILLQIVTNLKELNNIILNVFFQIIQNMGTNILHLQYLNLIRNTLLLVSRDADKPSINLFLIIIQKFALLFNEDLQWLKCHVDILEDVADFFSQIIKKLPNVINQCPDEVCLIDKNILIQVKSGIQLHEQQTLKSISAFSSNFIEYTKLNQQASNILQQNGQEFIRILLKCIGESTPSNLIENLSFVFFTFSKSYMRLTIHWTEQCLSDPNFPSSSANQQHREAFLKILTSERTSRSNFKDQTIKFSLACREKQH